MTQPQPATAAPTGRQAGGSVEGVDGVVAVGASRPHRLLVGALLAIATVLTFFACFAVWVNRQALNTENWTDTSSRLLAEPHVQQAVSVFLVDEVFSQLDVPARLEARLPSQFDGLAGPLSNGLRQLAITAAPELLATPAAQAAWRKANHLAHEQLMRILEGGGKTVSTKGGTVVLDLHQLVTELAAQLGLSEQLAAARAKVPEGARSSARSAAEQRLGVTLPPSSGKIVIMHSDQLETAQRIVKAIRGLAIVLPLVGFALFILAVSLAKGRRRLTLRASGWCLFGIGVALLLLRRVGGDQVVERLVSNPANKQAAEAVWSIGTSLLYDIAIAMLVYGLLLVAVAWLGGATRPARFLRRALAPSLRMHGTGSYGVGAILVLLIVVWGPTPAFRAILPVIGFVVLVALGITVLRRQTAREFPDARPGEAVASLRASWPFSRHRA